MRAATAFLISVSSAYLAAPLAAGAASDPTPSGTADTYFLRSDCGAAPGNENCFETSAEIFASWLWETRQPSSSDPVVVEVGPGSFGPLTCTSGEGVSVRGRGPQTTRFEGLTGAAIFDCSDLSISQLGIRGDVYGVVWNGPGDAVWSNVDIQAGPSSGSIAFGWLDDCVAADPRRSSQRFHGSRIRVSGGATSTGALWTRCADISFYGGELLMDVDGVATGTNPAAHAAKVAGASDVLVVGAALRARLTADFVTDFVAVSVESEDLVLGETTLPAGGFRMHGGIINASVGGSVTSAVNATGVRASRDGVARTPTTAFVVRASASGGAKRVETFDAGRVESPFLWQAGAFPPQSDDETSAVGSLHGQDLFVETDCSSGGDCAGGGSEPHLMISSTACPSGWFDVIVGDCRP